MQVRHQRRGIQPPAAPAGPVFVLAYSLISCLIYAPWVVYLLARGGLPWSGAAVGIVLVSGLVHLGYNLCLQRGYQVADLSVVYPVARGSADGGRTPNWS